MTDTNSTERRTESDSTDARTYAVSRRSALRTSALLTSAGVGGLATGTLAGSAAAAGACGDDNPYDPGTVDYVWEKGDDKVESWYCDDNLFRGQKTIHAASTQYLGSAQDLAGEWNHFFQLGGHCEYYDGGWDCDWSHAAGITGHKATIDNNDTWNDALDPANSHDVAGLPAAGGDNGLLGDLAEELAMTGISEAMAYYFGTWAGVAAGITLALLHDSQNDDTTTGDELMYDWDYGSSYKKCGSHFVDFDMEGTESVSMDVTDEAWGMYPNYTQVYKEIDFLDATETSTISGGTTSTSSSDLTTRNSGQRRDVAPGDVIETTNGEPVRVTDVSVQTSLTPGRAPREISGPDDLSRVLQYRLGDTEPVRYAEFPAQVRTMSIGGEMLV